MGYYNSSVGSGSLDWEMAKKESIQMMKSNYWFRIDQLIDWLLSLLFYGFKWDNY
jgi:hypothetical protein